MSKTPKDPDSRTSIYVLKDPETLEIRYVGKTVSELKHRLKGHIYRSKLEKNHRAYWIKSILDKGLSPLIEEIDSCQWTESQNLEIYYIKKYKDLNFNLVNSTEGGEGNLGYVKSEETIDKLKNSLRKNSPTIYQYSLEGDFIKEWENAPIASEVLGISYRGIRRCASGERKKYKNFQWSYEKLENKEEYSREKHSGGKPGFKQSDLSCLIKLEENYIKAENVYIFKTNFNEDNFLFEARTLKEAANYMIDSNLSSASETSLKNSICQCALNKTSYLKKFFFTKEKPEFILTPKPSMLIRFRVIDENNILLNEIDGLDNLCNILDIKKTNVINNIKGVTKTLNFNNQKVRIEWKKI